MKDLEQKNLRELIDIFTVKLVELIENLVEHRKELRLKEINAYEANREISYLNEEILRNEIGPRRSVSNHAGNPTEYGKKTKHS